MYNENKELFQGDTKLWMIADQYGFNWGLRLGLTIRNNKPGVWINTINHIGRTRLLLAIRFLLYTLIGFPLTVL